MFRLNHIRASQILVICLVLLAVEVRTNAQSSSQDFPTPVTGNEITGSIQARDVGDARVTTYYYKFEGEVGDVFVNVSTKNFSGDIDIFADNGLRPLSKIVVYADLAENETGRVIYLRKPERLTLRIQGRSPGDEPASYRIKFAGSFVASRDASPSEPDVPKVVAQADTGIRVNSVGTIIEVTPKPKKLQKPTENQDGDVRKDETVAEERAKNKKEAIETATSDNAKAETPAPEVVITERIPKPEKAAPGRSRSGARRAAPSRTAGKTASPPKKKIEPGPAAPAAPDPLASIHLIIQFKDGRLIERPMTEVFKFSVDKGVLTVISKDGSIGKYSILDVEKLTIQ